MNSKKESHLGQLLLEKVGVGNLPDKETFLKAVRHVEDDRCRQCRDALECWWPTACSKPELAYRVFEHMTELAELSAGESAADNESLAPLVQHQHICSGCQREIDHLRVFFDELERAPIREEHCINPSLGYKILIDYRGRNLSKELSNHVVNCPACKKIFGAVNCPDKDRTKQIVDKEIPSETDCKWLVAHCSTCSICEVIVGNYSWMDHPPSLLRDILLAYVGRAYQDPCPPPARRKMKPLPDEVLEHLLWCDNCAEELEERSWQKLRPLIQKPASDSEE